MKPWCGVCRLGSIGDSLIATSILPLLAKDYSVEVICQEPHHVVYENNPFISKLTVKKQEDFDGDWLGWWDKRTSEYAKAVQLSHTCEVGLAFVKVQTERVHDASFRRWRAGHSYLEYVHRVADVPFVFNPRFFPTAEEHVKAAETKKRVGDRVVGFVVSGSRIDKLWPYTKIAVGRIIRELNVPVILFGGPGRDYEIASSIREYVKMDLGSDADCHIAISQPVDKQWKVNEATGLTEIVEPEPLWPIRRSLTQVQHCDLVISPDTGLAWGVAMEDMPKIVLVSHASDVNITSHWRNTVTLHADQKRVPCWPCHILHDDEDSCLKLSGRKKADSFAAACMEDIPISAVIEAAKEALDVQHVAEIGLEDLMPPDPQPIDKMMLPLSLHDPVYRVHDYGSEKVSA